MFRDSVTQGTQSGCTPKFVCQNYPLVCDPAMNWQSIQLMQQRLGTRLLWPKPAKHLVSYSVNTEQVFCTVELVVVGLFVTGSLSRDHYSEFQHYRLSAHHWII